MNTVDTRYLVILGTLPKCRHIGMSTLAYADEFSLCLKLYKCACLTYKLNFESWIFIGVKNNSIAMYMGKNISKKAKLVQMLPFLNILIYFISIECYYYFQSSSLRYTCFQIETCMVFLFCSHIKIWNI